MFTIVKLGSARMIIKSLTREPNAHLGLPFSFAPWSNIFGDDIHPIAFVFAVHAPGRTVWVREGVTCSPTPEWASLRLRRKVGVGSSSSALQKVIWLGSEW